MLQTSLQTLITTPYRNVTLFLPLNKNIDKNNSFLIIHLITDNIHPSARLKHIDKQSVY